MKKTILSLTISLYISFSFAQLNVVNDGFLFVSNQIIFVENEVNLSEANSKIYLRNEAQLIQGNELSANIGNGELSIYQTGNSNNFAYNYWCSPVGVPSEVNGNSPNQVNLIDDPTGLTSSIDASFTTAYDGTTAPLTISSRWLYTYVTSDDYSEWNAINESSPILTGLGFTMKGVVGGNQLYDFRGKPNNGEITNAIAANQFTLIGNPYPSAIDAMLFIHDADNTNINSASELSPVMTGALYFWEQQPTSHVLTDYIGGYATYTISDTGMPTFAPATFQSYDGFGNPIPIPPGFGTEGDNIAKRYIPVGQGFMVEGAAAPPANQLVYLKNEHRVFEKISDGSSAFFRTSNVEPNANNNETVQYNEYGLNIIPDDHKRFRLNVIFNDEFTRQLVQNFHDTATDAFDYGLEAKMASSSSTEASWILDDSPYVIQAHAFETSLTIPVKISAENNQPLSFSVFDVQNFDESQSIYLHDTETDIYVDLIAQSYAINIDAGTYPSRFEIVFEQNTLSDDVFSERDLDVFANYKTSELTILNPKLQELESVSLYDINGKQIFKHHISDLKSVYNFSSEALSDGFYIAKITNINNKSVSKKLIIKQ